MVSQAKDYRAFLQHVLQLAKQNGHSRDAMFSRDAIRRRGVDAKYRGRTYEQFKAEIFKKVSVIRS